MRLVTWNVNSLSARLPRVTEWVEANQPDVLCMQETKLADDAFPVSDFRALGYEVARNGDGRWNGVAIASRVGLESPSGGFGTAEDAYGARLVGALCGGLHVLSVYVPNGRSLDSEHYGYKLAWLDRLASYLAERCDPLTPLAVCGDFNIAPDDSDLWDPARFVGMTHASPAERQALQRVLDWGLEDVFKTVNPEGGIFSWWDYRAGDFHEGRGMRIDLALLSRPLAVRCRGARVDRDARKGKKPSDHAPVVVELGDEPTGG
jgi:exodeoxyribonuclease-3